MASEGERMKERPILFNTEMVKAVLSGNKTQTRRVIKIQPPDSDYQIAQCISTTGDKKEEGRLRWIKMADNGYSIGEDMEQSFLFPYGKVGDRLWVRETFKFEDSKEDYELLPDTFRGIVHYKADNISGGRITPKKNKRSYMAKPLDDQKWKPSIFMFRDLSRINLEIIDIRVERVQDITLEDAIAEGFGDEREFNELFLKLNPKLKDINPWAWVVEFKIIKDN